MENLLKQAISTCEDRPMISGIGIFKPSPFANDVYIALWIWSVNPLAIYNEIANTL